MTLKDDISRCHDAQCEVKHLCLRWVEREQCGQGTVHAFTLRPPFEMFDELCSHAIPIESDPSVVIDS